MSGHSKWHSIKHKKAAADAKRGKIFTKHAKLIAVAAREGGGDPAMNPGLRMAIDNAKASNMPNANIDRAVKKGTGELKDGAAIMEAMYEAFGPEGTAMLVEAVTDNKNRTVTEVKTAVNKNGGRMADAGSVNWMFKRRGLIIIDLEGKDSDEAEMAAIEAGASDVSVEGGIMEVQTDPSELAVVKGNLEGYKVESAELSYIPDNVVKIETPEQARKIVKFMDAVEDQDDVTNVFSNFDIPEEILESL